MVAKMHFFFKAKSSRIPKCHLLCHLFEAEQLVRRFTVTRSREVAREVPEIAKKRALMKE